MCNIIIFDEISAKGFVKIDYTRAQYLCFIERLSI